MDDRPQSTCIARAVVAAWRCDGLAVVVMDIYDRFCGSGSLSVVELVALKVDSRIFDLKVAGVSAV